MGKYDSIINHPHHESISHKRMSLLDRAAQFAPFAALTGYDAMIKEEARTVDLKKELSEEQLIDLDFKTNFLLEHIKEEPFIKIIYFLPDEKKKGGKYLIKEGKIKGIDEYNKSFIFIDKTCIALENIIAIDSNIFPSLWQIEES